MKSQAMAISVPPPNAKPFTAAITIIGNFCSLLMTFWPNSAKFLALSGLKVASSLISAPATKALSPAPVRIRTRIFSSAATWSRASDNSASNAPFNAFNAFGRLNVTVEIPSLTS
jgi:hypothetical protein